MHAHSDVVSVLEWSSLRRFHVAGQMADDLQKQAAEETASLIPPHTYVPWVTVNGITVGGALDQLQTFICAAYLGDR